jgi:hypothetical protein
MRNTLKWIRDRFNDPEIIITENGFSDNAGNLDDLMRVYYYKHNINNVLKGRIYCSSQHRCSNRVGLFNYIDVGKFYLFNSHQGGCSQSVRLRRLEFDG